MARIAADAEETRFAELIDAVIAESEALRDSEGRLVVPERFTARLALALEVDGAEQPEAIAASFAAIFRDAGSCRDMIALLLASSARDKEQGRRLERAALAETDEAIFAGFHDVVFTDKAGRRAALVTGAFAKANPTMAARLTELADSFEALHARHLSTLAFARSRALGVVAHDILTRLEAIKRDRRALDFADIITRTQALFARVASAWVLYKLDSGIDHLLIDEAQDTSAQQWDIIRRLTSEFFAGRGARGPQRRTVFAVGDVKQSIFSFQKAEPAAFAESLSHYERLAREAAEDGHRFERIALTQSFRSTREIMAGVDLIFADKARHRGLVFDGADRPEPHETARTDGIGAIDLWPLETNDDTPPRMGWDPAPVDAPSSAQQKLAARIAQVLRQWTLAGRDDLGRPFRPGDVLILLRKRGPLFELIVRALKQAQVPVAGLDRLDLSQHVAIDDIRAIGRAALLPEDDLTLATALKTPIFGLDDSDLLALAPERAGALRAALAAHPAYAGTHARLMELEARAAQQGPFAFFARLLGPEGGRHAMLARLGPEAGDALDAVLTQALTHEQQHGPSLIGFLEALAGADELKRDLAEEAGEVRVMTVHGAKGLEAPVVIIPDLGAPAKQGKRKVLHLVPVSEGNARVAAPIWTPRKELAAPATRSAAAAHDEAQEDERRRLFYVALTRAADRLILCGASAKGATPAESWRAMAEEALGPQLGDAPHPGGGDAPVRRFRLSEGVAGAHLEPAQETLPLADIIPDWVHQPAPGLAETPAMRAPSGLAAAAAAHGTAGVSKNARREAGLLAHRLLQHLPELDSETRPRAAAALAALHGAKLTEAARAHVVTRVLAILSEPRLSALFGPDSVAEAAVAGEITLGDATSPIAGRIDRLVVTAKEVMIADYKSGRAPATAEGVRPTALAQLAAYRRLMADIYPGRRISAVIIFLEDGALVAPDEATLEAALAGL